MSRRTHSLFFGMLLLACAGCGWRKCFTCSTAPCRTAAVPCREIEPLPPVPDVSQLADMPPPERAGTRFCALDERAVQCAAARSSKMAKLLTAEADAVASQRQLCNAGSELAQNLLLLQANHERNNDGATALTLLLRLVEAEGGVHNLGQRLDEIDGMLGDIEQMRQRGLAAPVSRSEVNIRQLDARHRQAEVYGNIDQLNYQLASAIGVAREPGTSYWPDVDLVVDPATPDVDAAVSLGLANRADLMALRCASQADGREAIAAAKLLMAPLGLGATDSCGCLKLLHLCGQSCEADARADQIAIARRQHERDVENEIRQAVDLVATRLHQVHLSRKKREAVTVRIESARRQREAMPSPDSARSLRLEALATDQELLHDVVEWKIALVKLKQAQGLLAVECGWTMSHCCH